MRSFVGDERVAAVACDVVGARVGEDGGAGVAGGTDRSGAAKIGLKVRSVGTVDKGWIELLVDRQYGDDSS